MAKTSTDIKDSLVQSLIAETRDVSVALATFSAQLNGVRETVLSLSKILKEGNGQASLMTRFSLLEKAVSDMECKLKSNTDALSKISQEDRLDKREKSKNKWVFYGSIVPSLLALAGTVVALLIH